MVDEKSPSSVIGNRDRELLIPVSDSVTDASKPSSSSSSVNHAGRETFSIVVRSWASKKFMTGCVILFPIAITFYITWWFIHFVDGFFSPIYAQLGINIFGLGFITSITFIFLIGVFMSSWLGASVLGLGEWFIKRMPLVRHIYNASKQISAAISPDQNSQAFKEVAIIRHPRVGEYALGFITSSVVLQITIKGEEPSHLNTPPSIPYYSMWDSGTHNTEVSIIAPSMRANVLWFALYDALAFLVFPHHKPAMTPVDKYCGTWETLIKASCQCVPYDIAFHHIVMKTYSGDEELCCVYVPTNHLYIGDIFLVNTKDVLRPNLSVREGIEIVVSGGMSMPQVLSTLDSHVPVQISRPDRTLQNSRPDRR
ncbi:Cov1 [Trifolium pratense]|uniref:Cov1 n=2 Tax=Trifolium pratense TaxID=57577 RepID=A0A2K3NPB4_TRIPR|nr:Cov1 [Trifolium pratense]